MTLRAVAAEGLGTAWLLVVVTGSGIMGAGLAGEDAAMALLANAAATGCGLAVLIAMFGALSGAHFNPAVSLTFCLRGELPRRTCVAYMLAQVTGGCIGVLAAHAMFDLPLLQLGSTARDGMHLVFSEWLATVGLIGVILAGVRYRPAAVPWMVGAWIAGAYWFTSSTSFANPAVTIARAATDTFVGIGPASVPGFLAAQFLAALMVVPCCAWLFGGEAEAVPAVSGSEDS